MVQKQKWVKQLALRGVQGSGTTEYEGPVHSSLPPACRGWERLVSRVALMDSGHHMSLSFHILCDGRTVCGKHLCWVPQLAAV